MKYYNHIVETIGNTPMVKLHRVLDTEATILAKVESFNPGHSTKDRMALKMIEDAEKVAYSKKEEQLLKELQETQVWDWPWHAYKKVTS